MHYLLFYETAPDYLVRRAEFRDAHLRLARQAVDRGALVLGGAVGEPAESALLLFSCESDEIPKAFAQSDPYVLNGLVKRWHVQPWRTVAGPHAADPIEVDC